MATKKKLHQAEGNTKSETALRDSQPNAGKVNFEKLGKAELERLLHKEMRVIESHVRLIETVCDTLLDAAKNVRKRMGMEGAA